MKMSPRIRGFPKEAIRMLSEDETAALVKGGNFAIIPKYLPTEEFTAGTEATIRIRPYVEMEQKRSELSQQTHYERADHPPGN